MQKNIILRKKFYDGLQIKAAYLCSRKVYIRNENRIIHFIGKRGF